MRTRMLGGKGPPVAAIGRGCVRMSEHYGTRGDRESMVTIQRALDPGDTFLDTAGAYGSIANVVPVGQALADLRCRQAVLARGDR